WKRLGTRTKRAPSGTVEEFQRAYELWKKRPQIQIMFYFNRTPVPPEEKELEQLRKVLAFRRSLIKSGLIADYTGLKDFEKQVRSHLSQVILGWNRESIAAAEPAAPSPRPFSKSVPVLPPPPPPPGLFVGREAGLEDLRSRLGFDQEGRPAGKMQPIT